MPHKGASTQCHNQQVLVKPRHSPSDRQERSYNKKQESEAEPIFNSEKKH